MRVYVLEPKPDSERHWFGYELLDRIAVVAANETEARRIAAASQSMHPRQKKYGRADLDEPNMQPWLNYDASTCRKIGEADDARVLAIQPVGVHVRDLRIMA